MMIHSQASPIHPSPTTKCMAIYCSHTCKINTCTSSWLGQLELELDNRQDRLLLVALHTHTLTHGPGHFKSKISEHSGENMHLVHITLYES